MAARPDDDVAGDPGPEAALPAAVGPPLAEGLVPSAEEWEHAWLPAWLSGSQADGVAGAGELPHPTVPPAGGADPGAGVPDDASEDGRPDHAVSGEAAVAEDGAPGAVGPDPVVPDPPLDSVATVRPRVVVAPRVRPRRRAGTAVALTLLTAGGIVGAVLLSGHSSGPVPTADRQSSPGAVVAPTRAAPTTPPAAIADAVPAAPRTTVPVPTTPVQEVSTAPAPAPVPVRVAVPPAAAPATVAAPDVSLSVVVPPASIESPVAVPTDEPTGPTAPTGVGVDPVVPIDEPAPTPLLPPAGDPDEDPVDDRPDPTDVVPPGRTDVPPPGPTDVPPPGPTDVLPPGPTDGDGTGTPTPGTPEPTAPEPEALAP